MTMRTYYKVVCDNCGNEGNIVRSENDQPFSSMWESWSLKNISGCFNEEYLTEGWEIAFSKSNLKCASCNTRLKHNNLQL